MQKVAKDNYEQIISELEPLFDKWGAKVITSVLWRYNRTKSRLQELKEEQIRINKELAQYEKAS